MALEKCAECGNEISSSAPSCPKCGAVPVRTSGCLVYGFLIFVGLFVFIGISGKMGIKGKDVENAVNELKESLPANSITFDKFQQIKDGMSYQDVVKVMAVEGKESASSKVGSNETRIFSWVNITGSNVQITFENNRVTGKMQFGLK